MKKILLMVVMIGVGAMSLVSSVAARDERAPAEDAKYTAVIEKRTGDVLAALDLKDEAKVKAVHDAVMAQYRGLHDWQAANEEKLKELKKQKDGAEQIEAIGASRKGLRDAFEAKLGAVLTPEQVEIVKDKLTYNKVKVTYDAYCQIVPNLTDADKAKMLELLKEAREEAIDGTSSDEKAAIFKKYKGKINNYLSKAGHDVGKAYKDWGAKAKDGTVAPVDAPTK